MRPRAARALAMSGLFALLTMACEDRVRVEAYPDDEPRPMFGGLRVLRGAGTAGRDRLELVVSDRPIDCSALGGGRLVLRLALYDWRSGSRPVDLSVAMSDVVTARMRWAVYPPDNQSSQTLGLDEGLLSLPVRQDTAPTRRREVARFELPLIRVATLPPVEPGSCCAQHDSDDRAQPCSEQCPLPIRVERLSTALDVELCDDIDLSTIERQR